MQTIEAHYTLARVAQLFSDRPVTTEVGTHSARVIASGLYDASWLLQASLEAHDGVACTGSAVTLAHAVALLEKIAGQVSQGPLLQLFMEACYALSAGDADMALHLGTRIALALEAPEIDPHALQLLRRISSEALQQVPSTDATHTLARIAHAAASKQHLEDALASMPAALSLLRHAATGRVEHEQATVRVEGRALHACLLVACRQAGIAQSVFAQAVSSPSQRLLDGEDGSSPRWTLLAGAKLPAEPGRKVMHEDEEALRAALTAYFAEQYEDGWVPLGTILTAQARRLAMSMLLQEAIPQLPTPALRISMLAAAVAALASQPEMAMRLLELNAQLADDLPDSWQVRAALLRQPIRRHMTA